MTESLKDWIKSCEGYESHPYLDTVGKVTIGYGRNIGDNGISLEEAQIMFNNDSHLPSHSTIHPFCSTLP